MLEKLLFLSYFFLVLAILDLDNFGKESLGLAELFLINSSALLILKVLSFRLKILCRYGWLFLIFINVLLLFNGVEWSEARGAKEFIIPILGYATDVLYSLILFSSFLFMVPIGLYIGFLISAYVLFCF